MSDAQAKAFPSESDAIGRKHTAVKTPIESKQTDGHLRGLLVTADSQISHTRYHQEQL